MPPKSSITFLDRTLSSLIRSPFICPACRRRKAFHTKGTSTAVHGHSGPRPQPSRLRTASTTAAVTAVNAKTDINPAFRDLYASLKALEIDAGVYVNTSQLRLAVRGLESENAVTRIAVLGLNGQYGARRLARVLLADPLASEQTWESLITGTDSDEKALLLRYGEQTDIDDRHPLVKTLLIPCPLLHTYKLEILVHTTGAATESTSDGAASFLVPSLDMMNSASGRSSTITYPVHKTLVYEEGLKSLASFATIESDANQCQGGQMFRGVIDWSWSISTQGLTKDLSVSPINLALAEAAIDAFRQSLNRSMDYEHMWFDAGMLNITSWLSEGTDVQPGAIKPPIRRLVQTICKNSSNAIKREEASRLAKEKAETVPFTVKSIIEQGISIWAENAHTELRVGLDTAFNSRGWRKTKWWKLFWRVDDVGSIASDLLQRAWLVDSEKEMIWLSGRIHQSGLLGPPKLDPDAVTDPEDEHQFGRAPPTPTMGDIVIPPTSSSEFYEPPPVVHPWHQYILDTRVSLSRLTIPPLQALSQSLLFQTISTNVLTSSLSGLLYVSISTISLYEAGAVAAVGLVYSLRRLQKRWENARTEWQMQIREKGREALKVAEEDARRTVREGGKPEVDEVGMSERREAMEAVKRVKRSLDELESK